MIKNRQLFLSHLLYLILLSFCFCQTVFAEVQIKGNVIYGLNVRVKSVQGVDPRHQAMLEAQRLAFKVFNRQQAVPDEKMSFLESLPSDDELSNMVEDVTIQKEKITTTGYQATINLTFKPHSLDKWIKREEKITPQLLTQNEVSPSITTPSTPPPRPQLTKKMLQTTLHAFQDWLQVQRLLEALPNLSTLNILEFSQTSGKVEVEWKGAEEALEASLQDAGFVVTKAENETWHIEKKLPESTVSKN